MKTSFLLLISILALAGCTSAPLNAPPPASTSDSNSVLLLESPVAIPSKAQTVLKSQPGSKVKGLVHFTENNGVMKVEVMVEGLKPGPHGFHIHEIGDCSKPDYSSAGGHFNPTKNHHGSLNTKTRHAGDFGNLIANAKGKAVLTLEVSDLTLKPGATSILGKSVIVHRDQDDLKSQPAGNSGPRIACGVIEAL
ncbi:MAG: superoxide dismutase family protein [Bdellovibrio sp.]